MTEDFSSFEKHLGNKVKAIRQKHSLTLSEVADKAQISLGTLSKIENGVSSSTIETLEKLAGALGVSIYSLFSFDSEAFKSAQFIKNDRAMEVVRRGTQHKHSYNLLFYEQGPKKKFEAFLINIDKDADSFPMFEHEGTEFLYILSGKIDYRCGDEVYSLQEGDSLTFKGETPHGPEKFIEHPIKFISITIYNNKE